MVIISKLIIATSCLICLLSNVLVESQQNLLFSTVQRFANFLWLCYGPKIHYRGPPSSNWPIFYIFLYVVHRGTKAFPSMHCYSTILIRSQPIRALTLCISAACVFSIFDKHHSKGKMLIRFNNEFIKWLRIWMHLCFFSTALIRMTSIKEPYEHDVATSPV